MDFFYYLNLFWIEEALTIEGEFIEEGKDRIFYLNLHFNFGF